MHVNAYYGIGIASSNCFFSYLGLHSGHTFQLQHLQCLFVLQPALYGFLWLFGIGLGNLS